MIKADTIQVMLDTETMGKRTHTAPIISIGAVKFSIDQGVYDQFKVNISLKDQLTNYGRIAEQGTVDWWNTQNPIALKNSMTNVVSFKEGYEKFKEWYGPISYFTWANGTDFDMPKLKEMFITLTGDIEVEMPWKYWHQMDYRTILNLFDYDNRKVRALQEEKGAVYHDALSDCIGQAEFLIDIQKALLE